MGHITARNTASVLVASLSSDSDVCSSTEVEGSLLKRGHRNLAGLESGTNSFSDGLSTGLAIQVAKGTPLVLGGEDFKAVASDGRTTVSRSSPGELDIACVGSSVEAHRLRYRRRSDLYQVRPTSPSTRVSGANLEAVNSLTSVSESNSSREVIMAVDLSLSSALAVKALVHFIGGGSTCAGVSESHTSSTLVNNSESSNSSIFRLHSGSELSRSARRSEGASSLVASSSSGNDLGSIGKFVSSSSKFGHGDSAGLGSSSSSS